MRVHLLNTYIHILKDIYYCLCVPTRLTYPGTGQGEKAIGDDKSRAHQSVNNLNMGCKYS